MPERPSLSRWSLFLIFLRLGLTSFGGPVAHLGYFREEFVRRRQWLTEKSYADLVALCQFLPGPASSQVGLGIGLSRGGYRGALAAWAGFTLPSALALTLFALGLGQAGETLPAGLLNGLKLAAVAVVAQAVWGMARQHCPDRGRVSLMLASACFVLLVPLVWAQLLAIALAGGIGLALLSPPQSEPGDRLPLTVSRRAALSALAVFFTLLAALPLLALAFPSLLIQLFDSFYRAGSLVFGGGHVVLPLLQAEVVPPGWVDRDTFMAGYGAAQAIPGPLFTFSAFLGAAAGGWFTATVALVAIFVPSFLLVIGALPFWERLRGQKRMRAALAGINAGVVGLLLAALYQPVWTSAVHRPADFALALAALVALSVWRLPPWLVVAACGLFGWVLAGLI